MNIGGKSSAQPTIEQVRAHFELVAQKVNSKVQEASAKLRHLKEQIEPDATQLGDYWVITGAFFDRETDTLQYTYIHPSVTAEESRLLNQEIVYWHSKHNLAQIMCGRYRPVFEPGARISYVYLGRDGLEMFRVVLDKAACGARPLVSRADLQASLERSATFVNANLGRINTVLRQHSLTDPTIDLAGAWFKDNTFVYVYRDTGPGNDIPLTQDEIRMTRDAGATPRCRRWEAYLEAGFATVDLYVDARNREFGAVVYDEPFCRPHLARVRQWQENVLREEDFLK